MALTFYLMAGEQVFIIIQLQLTCVERWEATHKAQGLVQVELVLKKVVLILVVVRVGFL